MFALALLIGIYSYIIFLLGLSGFLYKQIIILASVSYVAIALFCLKKKIDACKIRYEAVNFIKNSSRLELMFLVLIFFQLIVNLIGALGPELGFDALWYHLTLPKNYLENHRIFYIPGGLFYYSAMPKLAEMLYVGALSFGTETVAKLIHFSFGIMSLIALYGLSRKFLPKTYSLLVLVIFYSNLVVGWMSITAYIDLARTFFEITALWGFIQWQQSRKFKRLVGSAIILGLAISAKLLALGSLFIFVLLIIIFTRKITNVLKYSFITLIVPLPWFVFSYIHTGNPFYPFFTDIYRIKPNVGFVNPLTLSDPISPLYVIFLPLALFFYKKFTPSLKIISLYSFLAIVVWYLTPQTGGGRFILPYLPAFSLVTVVIIAMIRKVKLRYIFIWSIVIFSLFSIFYRGIANFKYVPVILKEESKDQFLSKHLNFSFGDFYDIDGYFAETIAKNDTVLLYGFHNLYYVNFPFIDSSYAKKRDTFNYVAVQGNDFPKRFEAWNLIYYNIKTNVRLYSAGRIKWVY